MQVDAGCAFFCACSVEVWPTCVWPGSRAGGGYEGRGAALFPPFLAGDCGVCPSVGCDVAPPFLVGFVGVARGMGFCLYPAGLALAVWRVVLSAFSLTPARGVSFPRLGCVVALCGAGPSSPVPGACPVRCGGSSSIWVVVCPCLSRERCAGRRGPRFSPPLFFYFPAFPLGNLLSVVGRGRVAFWPGGRRRMSLAVPRPPRQPFLFRPRGRWPASSLAGVCAGVSRVSLPLGFPRLRGCGGPLCLAGRRQAAGGGLSVSDWWVLWAWPMLLPGWGGGGCPPRRWGCLASRVCGCPSRFPPLPQGGRCAFVGWGGPSSRFLFVGGSCIPPSLSCSSFLGGEVCLFLPLPSLSMHWSVSGVVNWLAVLVAGGRGACYGSVRHVAYVHSWVGGPLCRRRARVPPAGRLRQPVLWGHGSAGAGGGWGASLGCPVSSLPCGIGLVLAGLTFRWWFVLAGRCGWRAGVSSGFCWRSPVSSMTECCRSLKLT